MIRRLWLCVAGGMTLLGCVWAPAATAAERPNIVLILSDDMGYSDIGCYGGEIETPNLDALAAGGLQFTQFYNTGRCCPTRASLLTGLYPHQAGVGHMMEDRGHDGYRGNLNDRCVTISEVLKSSGYATYMTGKWHVTRHTAPDGPKFNWPVQRGFDRFYGTIHGAGSFYDPNSLVRGNGWISPYADPEYQPEQYYYTDAISDHAVRYVAEHDPERPFFMYVAYTAAHWPMHALPEDIAKYRGRYDDGYGAIRRERYARMQSLGLIPEHWGLSEQAEDWDAVEHKEWEIRCMEVYAAMVDRMDQGIGRIVAALRERGELDNTLILFLQDNGGCAETLGRTPRNNLTERPAAPTLPPMAATDWQYDMIPKQTRDGFPTVMGPGVLPGPDGTYIAYGRGWANVSNTPFREYKHWVHEGGISTPLIAHWPAGMSRRGEFERTPGHLVDVMATCVDAAGADYPERFNGTEITPLAGTSLRPLFAGQPLERDTLYWEHEGNRAIRVGDWKLVAKGANGPWELYDMAQDRSELRNLAETDPDKVRELSAKWQAWAERSHVLPLNPRPEATFNKRQRVFQLTQGDDLNRTQAPYVEGRPFAVTCRVRLTGANGVLVAQGGTADGWSLYLQNGTLHFAVRHSGKLTEVTTKTPLKNDTQTIAAALAADGTVTLSVDGTVAATGRVTGTLRRMPLDGLQVGADEAGAVGHYEAPFALQGNVEQATLTIGKN